MPPIRTWRAAGLLAATLCGLSLLAFRAAPPAPALVLLVVVDQMRGDYLQRWQGQWQGGFARLLKRGAVFPHGFQQHAITATAPGHSTLLSGREPASTGIYDNQNGVPDSTTSLIGGSTGKGASPRRFRGTALVDWMRERDSSLKVLSIAGKDRAAILPVGSSRAAVYWTNRGRLTTSTYYADTLPAWVAHWNARRGAEGLAGHSWTLLLPDSSYPEPDDATGEYQEGLRVFPHQLPDDPEEAAREVGHTPWSDSLLLDAALEGARSMQLGRRATPDVLILSLSATDEIGHRFGPDSREVHDQLLRVDHWLAWFLDSLATMIPAGRTVIALSADHGVTRIPEVARARGEGGGRVSLEPVIREANRQIGGKAEDSTILLSQSGLITGNPARLRAIGVTPESLATALLAQVWRVPGIRDAWTPATLAGAVPTSRFAARWMRSIPRSIPWFVAAVPDSGWVWGGTPGSAEHGAATDDDASVPVVFLGPGVRAGLFPDTVLTVDIAPTLAHLLGVEVPRRIDGRRIRRVSQ